MLAVKTAVNKELETKRAEKVIGSGLSAEVDLYCDADLAASLNSLGDELRFVLIVSRATVHALENVSSDAVTTDVNANGVGIIAKILVEVRIIRQYAIVALKISKVKANSANSPKKTSYLKNNRSCV